MIRITIEMTEKRWEKWACPKYGNDDDSLSLLLVIDGWPKHKATIERISDGGMSALAGG